MIIAANWKMNPSLDIAVSLVSALNADSFQPVKLILFVPHPFLMPISVHLGKSDIRLGGQDCHQEAGGAHTGDVAAEMLKDCGASVVLLGHSERRKNHCSAAFFPPRFGQDHSGKMADFYALM